DGEPWAARGKLALARGKPESEGFQWRILQELCHPYHRLRSRAMWASCSRSCWLTGHEPVAVRRPGGEAASGGRGGCLELQARRQSGHRRNAWRAPGSAAGTLRNAGHGIGGSIRLVTQLGKTRMAGYLWRARADFLA